MQDQGAPGGNSPSGAQTPNRFAGSTLGWSSAPSSSVSWGLHLPSSTPPRVMCLTERHTQIDRKSTRLNSSHVAISYAVFCLKKKNSIYHHKHVDIKIANIDREHVPLYYI